MGEREPSCVGKCREIATYYKSLYGVAPYEAEELALMLLDEKEPDIFEPAARLNIDRKDIPVQIAESVAPFGRLVAPKEYFPDRPNVYLIPLRHVIDGHYTAEVEKLDYRIQRESVEIFHQLYAVGAKYQLLEGVRTGTEMKHNVDHPVLKEEPFNAMAGYKSTGKIHRANVAIEGIYKDKIQSIGIEGNYEKHQRLKRAYKIAHREYPKVLHKIAKSLCDLLGAPFSSKATEVLQGIKAKTKVLSKAEKGELIARLVDGNSELSAVVQAMAVYENRRIKGRNDDYTIAIKALNGDSAFPVGSYHTDDLKRKLTDRNVFVIVPKSLPAEDLHTKHTDFEVKDHVQSYKDRVAKIFGLRD